MSKLDEIREQKLIALAKACFDPPPTAAEEKVLRDSASSVSRDMLTAEASRPDIRPEFLRWLATDPEAATHIDPKGLLAINVTLQDKLDLQNCRVLVPLHFQHCTIKKGIDLRSAETKSIQFLDSAFEEILTIFKECKSVIRADRINVDGPLYVRGSNFFGEIRLIGAKINGSLDCNGAKLKVNSEFALTADRAEVGGLLNLGQGTDLNGNPQIFESNGTIRLPGTKINGDLSLGYAQLRVAAGRALWADSAEIGGNVWLNFLESTGTISLPYAQISGVLSCSGAKLQVKAGDALFAEGAMIRGSVYLNAALNMHSNQLENFESTGTIRIPGAQIKGVLSCSGAKLNGPVMDALFADCAVVGANVCLDKGFESSGAIRLLGAGIDGELGFIGAKPARVICKDLHLRGDMWWTGIQEPQEAILDLTGATVKSLHDDRESWPSPKHLTLDGLAYEELVLHERPTKEQVMSNAHGSELPFKVEERIEWLMLQTHEHCIKPGAWMQLSELLKAMGNRKGSKHVIFIYRRLLAKEKELHPLRWLLQRLFRLSTFRRVWPYLRHPNRSCAIAFAWLEEAPERIWISIAVSLLFGCLVFGYAGTHGAIAPTEAEAYKAFIAGKPLPYAYPALNPIVYTLENAVPLVKLGQDEKWAPDKRYPGTNWFTNYWFMMWTRWVLILFGWFQAGVLGAALLRRFKE